MTEPEGGKSNDDDAAMRARLAALSRDLSRGPEGASGPASSGKADGALGSALSLGVRVTSEFVAAVLVSGFIGWQIDRWLHSSPAALILFIGLGTAAGFYGVYRIATKPGGK